MVVFAFRNLVLVMQCEVGQRSPPVQRSQWSVRADQGLGQEWLGQTRLSLPVPQDLEAPSSPRGSKTEI